ncbi:MAG: glucosamine-6-phosphate deaminase [Ktedonobacteraceae bacterium]|nr:glucosamine-6-phosphate deaminase [Ktedonobacteraceae bacterium]
MPDINGLIATRTVDQLQVQVYNNRQALGAAAGQDVAAAMRHLLSKQDRIRMIFAAAPSQNEFLQTLSQETGIDWSRVSVFHMDEYLGLSLDAPQRFGRFLSERLFDKVRPGQVHLIDSTNALEAESKRYSDLLAAAPIDIVCLGIGENGHIAFNDPPVADFHDPLPVKPVELDTASRQQQVNDGCFDTVAAVPTHALTLTIPALLSGKALFCMVPGQTKRHAVQQTLGGPIDTVCPATILRQHPRCTLYVDRDSYGIVER